MKRISLTPTSVKFDILADGYFLLTKCYSFIPPFRTDRLEAFLKKECPYLKRYRKVEIHFYDESITKDKKLFVN